MKESAEGELYLDDGEKGTTNLTFFLKMKNTDPLIGAKLKSKTHILNTFLIFEPFFECLV